MTPRIRAGACACAIPLCLLDLRVCLLDFRQEIDEVASPRRELLKICERRSGGPVGMAVAVATVPREQRNGGLHRSCVSQVCIISRRSRITLTHWPMR